MTPWPYFLLGALCATTVCVIAMRAIIASAGRMVRHKDRQIRWLELQLASERKDRAMQELVFGGGIYGRERN